jgi:S-(hydroxymethyl)glutathione dehydrogenase/alcohol dehydrogenase
LSTTMAKAHVEPGSDVVVFGCGPLGLSAVQGARIQGAAQIIAVEPIKYRRDLALKLGATTALDPNAEGNNLVANIRGLCKSRTERWAGGGNTLPDLVVEAVGGDIFPPKAESGPDPTGVLSLHQAWQLCSPVGRVVTTGGYAPGTMITFPTGAWANGPKCHLPGNVAGANSLRDLPKFVRLIEAGLFDAKALATATYPLDRAREAFQAVADRTTVAAVLVYS